MIEFALIATILSGVCYSLMVVTDKLLIGDCYQKNSNQAWFVSSVAGSLFGLALTVVVILGFIIAGQFSWIEFMQVTQSLFIWKGFLMILIGAAGIQILLHYFRCFAEEANSAAIASWFAATPIFIYLGMYALSLIVPLEEAIKPLTDTAWIVGILIATFGLIGFEMVSGYPNSGKSITYARELFLMLLFNVVYIIGLTHLLSSVSNDNKLIEVLAFMPFYWIGFAAGSRIMFSAHERAEFSKNWKNRLHLFIVPILLVEIIGMLVFWFEYFGLTELDPAYVSIIIGANIYLVYILNHILSYLRVWMLKRNITTLRVWGIQFVTDTLPHQDYSKVRIFLEIFMILVTIIGISLISEFI